MVYTSKSFYNSGSFSKIFRIYVNLAIITWSLSFWFVFLPIFNCMTVFSFRYFLFSWTIDLKDWRNLLYDFHLRFIWSLLSYRFDPAFWFTSAGTKCFGSSPITGFTLSASHLLFPLVVGFIIAHLFCNVNSFFQLCEKILCYFTNKLFRIDFSLQMV